MGLATYLATSILAYLFSQPSPFGGGVPIYTPSPMFLAFYDPEGFELVGQPGYARVELPASTWGVAVNGMISNEVVISFPTATGDWSKVANSWALLDNVYGYALVTGFLDQRPLTVKQGDVPTFNIDTLGITLDGVSISGGFSDYAENKLMDHFFGKANYSPPSVIYAGLLTAYPGDGLTNENCNEVPWSGTSYWRAITSSGTWEVGGAVDLWNVEPIIFPQAEEPWGTVNHYALFDVMTPVTEGHALIYGPIVPAREILVGSIPKFGVTSHGPPPTLGIDMGIFDL